MNILFAGTPKSSANILQSLINDDFNIIGKPDKKGKRQALRVRFQFYLQELQKALQTYFSV